MLTCFSSSLSRPGCADNQQGDLFLQVKWKGYDKPEDLTWEPEENLKCAHICIAHYIPVYAPADTCLQGWCQ